MTETKGAAPSGVVGGGQATSSPGGATGDTSAPDETRIALPVGYEDLADGYRVLNADGTETGSGPAAPLGTGGAGVVYRAAYRELPDRAIKVLAPRQDLIAQAGWEKFEETFTQEIRTLAEVTHTRIAKILDYGSFEHAGSPYLFYAMDYIEGGHPFDEAIGSLEPSAQELIDVLGQVLDGLGYLHAQGIMHCDLKEENVLVRRGHGETLEATILDLGVAKRLKAPDDDPDQDPDTTTFFSSPKLMMEGWENRIGRSLTRAELLEMFPSHDLHCFGRLVHMVLESNPDGLGTYLGNSGLQALKDLDGDLACQPGQRGTAADLERAWRKLPPSWLAPMNVRELAVGGGSETSLPTPNGRVGLSERIKRTLNNQLFQRLRSVPQLEFLSMVFPGATHTRLLHSLTTFDTARLYLAHLANDPAFRLMAEPEDVEATLLWALLHDIGHYPLSHMFEDFAHEERRNGGDRTIPTDDDLFWCFVDPASVTGHFAGYPEIIERSAQAAGGSLGEGLFDFAAAGDRFSPEVLVSMHGIEARADPIHSILAGVISSPIDVDKVSYLQDDSLMSGVRFGQGIDLQGLLNALRVPDPDQIVKHEPVVALDDSGLAAAEGIILARYWMLRRVYWDQENRALMAMGKFVIRSLLSVGELSMEDYYAEALMGTQEHALRWLSDRFDSASSKGKLGNPVGDGPERRERNPLPGLRHGRREIYSRVLTISNDPDRADEQGLYEGLAFKDAARTDEIIEDLHAVLDGVLEKTAMRGDVLLDVPTREREQLQQVKVWVYSGRRPQDPMDLARSPIMGSLRSEFDQHVKKCRVLLHPSVEEEIGYRMDTVRASFLDVLRKNCGL